MAVLSIRFTSAETAWLNQAPLPCKKSSFHHSEQVVRVAGYALAVLATLLAARAAYLLLTGVSVLTPATVVGSVILVLGAVAFCYCRTQAQVVKDTRNRALEYIRRNLNANANPGIKEILKRWPILTFDEVAKIVAIAESAKCDLKEFLERNGPGALKFLPGIAHISPMLGEFVRNEFRKNSAVTFEHFRPYIDTIYAHSQICAHSHRREGLEQFVQDTLSGLSRTPSVAAPAAAVAPPQTAPSAQDERAFLSRLNDPHKPVDHGGIKAVLSTPEAQRLAITFEVVAPILVNDELERMTFAQFIDRNWLAAVRYAINGTLIQIRFIAYVREMCRNNPSLTLENFRLMINMICTTRKDLPRQDIDRKALEKEVASICAESAASQQ